ncbi:MAG: hypothetical protein MUD08_07320 [Cytophagales bacterium]|jgi:hypothetical protein|nr:hypothetical protein [Cytophagales bacterium]
MLTKSAYFKAVLSADKLEHQKLNISGSVFDEIEAYENQIAKKSAETMFKVDNRFVYGFYEPDSQTYKLVAFKGSGQR